jgi:hypothetical protein
MEKYLEDSKPSSEEIEKLYAISIISGNNIDIAVLNLYVRENDVRIRKEQTIEQIYYAECRMYSSKLVDTLVEYVPFENNKQEHISRWSHLFK